MKKIKEENNLNNFLEKLGITAKKITSPEDYTTDLNRIVSILDAGVFLIMLIQILQEFVSVIYLNYLLVFIGLTALFLFLFGRTLLMKIYIKEQGNELDNWESTMSYHSNFILSVFVPMVFFFDADIISFAGARLTNVVLLKEILILLAFLSLLLYKFIRRRLKQTTSKKAKFLCHIAFYYDIFLFYSIFTLVLGMANKDERLATFLLCAAITLSLTLAIPLFVTDKKKLLQTLFFSLFVIFTSFMLYEQYLSKMDTSYDFQPSVYCTSKELSENKLEIYCHFTDSVPNERLTFYFLFREENSDILCHAVAEYEFLPHKWREGIFTWYDSSFITKLRKKDIVKNAVPIELCHLTETISYSPDFPEAYKKYVEGTDYIYSGIEDHTTDLFLFIGNDRSWFRGFTLEKIPSLPEEVAQLR